MTMRFDRLNDCITALRSFKSRFCISSYANACGTPACVLGHYVTKYPRRSLVWQNDDLSTTHRDNMSYIVGRDSRLGYSRTVQKEFGLDTEDQVDELFGAWGCNNAQTRGEAIKYLKGFIREHGGKVTA